MKKNKKFCLWGFLMVLTFMCFNTHVFADDTCQTKLSSDNSNPEINDTFTVVLNLTNTIDKKCTVNLSYDNTKLSFVDGDDYFNLTREPLSVITKQSLTPSPKLTFKAIAGGSSTIKVTSVEDCGEVTALGSVDINVKSVNLKTLSVTNGELSPAFNPETLEYTATINSNKTTINATAEDGMTITGLGEQTLNPGEVKNVKITVTAKNKTKKTYSINLKTAETNKSDNRSLKSITFNGETINIEDEKSTYTLLVKNNIEDVDLKYELEDEKSKANIKGPKKLEVGINTFVITVTAEDGSTKEYKLLVTRADTKNIIDNDTNAILEEIENGEDKNIYVSVNQDDKNKIMDKTIGKALKKYGKTITYEVTNEEGDILYSISLNGKDIKFETLNLNFGITFKSSNKTKIEEIVKNAKVLYLNFDSKDKIPGNLTVKLFVGDKFKNKDVLYLYTYNEKSNKLEKVQNKLNVKNGYIEFKIEKLNEYVLSNNDFDAKEEVKKEKNNLLIYILPVCGLLIITGVVGIIIVNKKKKKKKENIEEINNDSNNDLENTIIVEGGNLNPSVIANTPSVVVPSEQKETENNDNTETPDPINENIENQEVQQKEIPQVENNDENNSVESPKEEDSNSNTQEEQVQDTKPEEEKAEKQNLENKEEIEIIDDLN